MTRNRLICAWLVCGALPAIASPSGNAKPPAAEDDSAAHVLRLDVIDVDGAPVSSFHVEALCGKMIEQEVHGTDGALTIQCPLADAFLSVSAPHFRPAIDHLVLPATMHVVLQRSPTIHVRLRDALTQRPIDSASGEAYAAKPLLEATPDGFDLVSFPARKFGLMITSPGYMPLLVGMPGYVEVDTTLDFTLRRLEDAESPPGGYDTFGVGAVLSVSLTGHLRGAIAGSPAATRLMPGDVIINVDGKRVWDEMPNFMLRDLLLGFEGTRVKVTLRRGTETHDVELVRSRYFDTAQVFPVPIVKGPLLAAPMRSDRRRRMRTP